MRSCWLLIVLSLGIVRVQAQQCTQALPIVIDPVGGDTPDLAKGVWYSYRQLGRPTATNPRIQYNSVTQFVEPLSGLPGTLQWRVGALTSSSGACQNMFWTGMYLNTGKEIGDEGTNVDNYIMRPTNYAVLYHDYQNLNIQYGCVGGVGVNGICTSPLIFVDIRKNPSSLSASESAAFDAIINGIFSQYCVTVDNIPKNTFTTAAFCPFVDPPPCVAADIAGMGTSGKPVPGSTPASGSSYSASTGCVWPAKIAPGVPNLTALPGNYYMYRYKYLQEQNVMPVNQYLQLTDVGPAVSPLSTITARMIVIQYSMYNGQSSTQCINGFPFVVHGSNGLNTGLILPAATGAVPQPLGTQSLVIDGNTALYYNCEAVNAQTGNCDSPTVVHMTRKKPLEMSQAEKDAADALEDSFFSKFGCSAKKDVPIVTWTNDKPNCPFVDPPECMQKHITGYEQTYGTSTGTGTTSGPTTGTNGPTVPPNGPTTAPSGATTVAGGSKY